METKRILLVEDHHETNRMLRTAIESLGQKYTIVNVPSGEEAIIEVRLGTFDLVITDVMLPGIDGLEFVERMRKISGEANIIIITGNPTGELEQKVSELNVHGFFIKPLDMIALLNTVRVALGLEGPKAPKPEAGDDDGLVASVTEGIRGSSSTSERLTLLRRDMGALAVYLVDQDGYITARAGDIAALDLENILGDIEVAFNAGLRVSQQLGFGASSNIQFFDGSDYGMYLVNVGQFFMLVIIYDSERSAKQIGQVMLYGRRGADDLLNMMAEIGIDHPQIVMPSAEAEAAIASPISVPPEAEEVLGTGPLITPPEPAPRVAVAPEPEPVSEDIIDLDLDALLGDVDSGAKDADSFWDDAVTEDEDEVDANSLSFEQAMKLGLFPDEDD